MMSNEILTRGLATFSDKCKSACYLVKSCRVSGCFGFDGTARNLRSLQLPTTSCTTHINNINAELDALSVSNACKAYIKNSTRKCECLDETVFDAITGAKLWITSGVQTSHDLNSTGLTTCISKNITIEALTNSCVSMATFNLKGPNFYGRFGIESSPFGMFGRDGNNTFYGIKLPSVGSYTVSIKPDYYLNKTKPFSFKAINC
jgi:hypothetical protein